MTILSYVFSNYLLSCNLSSYACFFRRGMPTVFIQYAVFCLGLSGLPTAYSAEILVVGTEFAQIFERDVSGEFTGFGVEIIRAMAKKTGDTVNFQIFPWARAQWMVENNQAQILVGPYKTVEREAKFFFASRAFYRDDMVFYVKKSTNVFWDGSYLSLRDSKIAVINGWVYGKQFESKRPELKLEMVYSLNSGIKMLLASRFDFLASNVRNTDAIAKNLGLTNDIVALSPIIDHENGYFAYCKQAVCDSLRWRFDEIFESMKTNGELAKIAQYYAVRLP
ncbi:ABC transporter substrate-binding protein [Undibacterium sp.]|uniref:substrate-binding periplasmic protein n=1 Tax=Undibacterium sp. TaxID=1914977 RepID=UPI0025CDAD4A|nr:transporter substrate-binding domain-containing protein [Undibacterium sp.]